MTVIQMSVLRDADEAKNAYRGYAMGQMRILLEQMQLGGLNTATRTVVLANGTVITCKKCYAREDIFIDIPPAVVEPETVTIEVAAIFLTTPRLFGSNDGYSTAATIGINGGYVPGVTVGNGGAKYPAQANTTVIFSTENPPLAADNIIVFRQGVTAGNTDWKGGILVDGVWTYNRILTWHGPPGRCIPLTDADGNLSFTTHTPGLTYEFDTQLVDVSGGFGVYLPFQQYTVFTKGIFAGGGKMATAPGLVLGAAFVDVVRTVKENGIDVEKTVNVLACVTCTLYSADQLNYSDGMDGIVYTPYTDGQSGFIYECWRQIAVSNAYPMGWELAAYIKGERPSTPFFFNASGTAAASVQQFYVYKWNGSAFAVEAKTVGEQVVTVATPEVVTGSVPSMQSMMIPYLKSQVPAFSSLYRKVKTRTSVITKTAEKMLCIDYQGDVEIIGKASLRSSDNTIVMTTEDRTYAAAVVYDDFEPVSTAINANLLVGDTVGATGGLGPFTAQFVGFSATPVGERTWRVTSLDSCLSYGSNPYIFTIKLTDCTGAIAYAEANRAGGAENGDGTCNTWISTTGYSPYVGGLRYAYTVSYRPSGAVCCGSSNNPACTVPPGIAALGTVTRNLPTGCAGNGSQPTTCIDVGYISWWQRLKWKC